MGKARLTNHIRLVVYGFLDLRSLLAASA